jgi:hypothetical protein
MVQAFDADRAWRVVYFEDQGDRPSSYCVSRSGADLRYM